MGNEERRAHPRVDLRLPLKYQVLAHVGTAEAEALSSVVKLNQTEDVSTSGACFRASEHLPKDTVLLLIFNFPTLAAPVKAVAMVAWCRQERNWDYRVGVKILAARPETIQNMIDASTNSSQKQGEESPE